MASFDFITAEDFRKSLQADYHELRNCIEVGALKAAHVLAGSIIEALLSDHLVSLEVVDSETALRMDLSRLVEECKKAGCISLKVADLSSAIRGYRNLIHPGRAIRTTESVSEHSAKITLSLVELIVDEVAEQKRQSYGLTAEQIVNKLQRDSSAIAIASHLLSDVRPEEVRRLLLSVIPERHLQIEELLDDLDDSLEKCFQVAYDQAEEPVRREVAAEYIRLLREESDTVIQNYDASFFKLEHFKFLSKTDIQMVKHHILAALNNASIHQTFTGFGAHIEKSEVQEFVDSLVRTATLPTDMWEGGRAESFLREELTWMTDEIAEAAIAIIRQWVSTFDSRKQPAHANTMRRILGEKEIPIPPPFNDADDDLPF